MKLKNVIIGVVCLVLVLVVESCISGEQNVVTGKNFEYIDHDSAYVYYHPVCPACGHVAPATMSNISRGESTTITEICDCWELYEIVIKRND